MAEQRVRIVSDGTLNGTDVTGADGQDIPAVLDLSVCIDWDKRKLPTATLNVLLPHVDITAQAEFVTTLADGKRYRLVEIEEGPKDG